ncbi:MAG: DUF4382 domain-containing protein [Sulfurimonadaceae bacterium]
MKFYSVLFSIILFIVLSLSGCSGDSSSSGESGTLALHLADAPLVDEKNVTGVYITITEIQYHANGGWHAMEEFNTSVNPINLLEWQDGKSISLGDFQMPAGKYTQMRFMLDAAEETKRPKSNTGCYIEFDGDRNETLYVPSGSQTGYKAIGNYDVPINGTVTMTADFDVRKSIVVTGKAPDVYHKLKPTIRLVVTDEAGAITGSVNELNASNTYVVYAYESSNDLDPDAEAGNDFENAVTSAAVKEGGSYTLSFLAEGSYDLIIAKYDGNGLNVDNQLQIGVNVQSGETTVYNVDWTL